MAAVANVAPAGTGEEGADGVAAREQAATEPRARMTNTRIPRMIMSLLMRGGLSPEKSKSRSSSVINVARIVAGRRGHGPAANV
jgi:hypothetical protein